MRYPLWLTTALLVVCAGAGQANEAQKQIQMNQAAQLQAQQLQAQQMQAQQLQAAQIQYQNQAYLAAQQQQMQQGQQMPAMAGFAGYDAMQAGANGSAQTAQYFMPSTNYAGYAGYNPYAYMYGGYGQMGYYPYYGGQQQPIIIQTPAPEPAKEEKPKEEPKEEVKPAVTPQPQPLPQPLPTREIVRVQTKTVAERSRPYLGLSGDALLWSPMSYMVDNVTDGATFDKGKPDVFGYGGQAVLGIDCCRFSSSSDLGMRFEAELGYNRFGIENETLTNTFGGKKDLLATMWSGAVNGYVEYKSGSVHPYVGGGVGGAIGIFDILNTTPDVDFRDGTYMAQAMAGVSVDFGNNLAGNVGYRFRHFGEMGDYDVGDAYKWRLGLENSHGIEAGLRIKF